MRETCVGVDDTKARDGGVERSAYMTAGSRGGALEEIDHFGRDDLAGQHVGDARG